MGLTCFKSPFTGLSCKVRCNIFQGNAGAAPRSQLLFAHPFVGWEIAPELMNSQLIVHLSELHKLFPALLVGLSEGFEDGEVGNYSTLKKTLPL